MYAQLCRKLSEEAPNFDAHDGPCTFNRHLLSKCQEEFERRRKASEMWERSNGQILTPEEEEQRVAARRKMVGNLRFIGELGKLEIITESILHKCIQQLLEKKRQRTIVDLAEDLECLCQMMRTCGKVLDKPKAKNLMDQYFERMLQLSVNPDLPSRIRFMLQDVLDLRLAKWVPRKIAQVDGPRTIQQVREDAARDLGVYIPPGMAGHPKNPNSVSPLSMMPDFFSTQASGSRTGMEDVFGAPALGNVTLGTGPGVISAQPDKFYESNGYANTAISRDPAFRARQQASGAFMANYYQNKNFNAQNFNRQGNQNNQQSNYSNVTNKELPPRFMKMLNQTRAVPSGANGDDFSLRPVSSSMVLKPNTPGLLPSSAKSPAHEAPAANPPQAPAPKPSSVLHKEQPTIVIKQVPADKVKSNKKEKEPPREEYMRRLKDVLESLLNGQDVAETARRYKELKIPDRFSANAVYTIIHTVLSKDESSIEQGVLLIKQLRADNAFGPDKLIEGVKQVLDRLEDLESEYPKVQTNVARFSASCVGHGLLTLSETLKPLDGGVRFPLFILILQAIHNMQGQNKLISLHNESKINLMNMLSEKCRSKEKLADVLENNQLSFLCPLLRIQTDLWQVLVKDPSPQVFYKHIKDTLPTEHHSEPAFVNALVAVLLKYITQETTMSSVADASANPEKALVEEERELLSRYKPVLQAFLHDRLDLQVVSIYALQVFTDAHNFPKGMLLRWFVNMYDLEIIEEEAFIMWKEDLSQDFPGKGKALFQVNQWLTWLEETEEDEEEEDEA